MGDVFISYKRDDRTPVARIVTGLRAAGMSVWWDVDIAPRAAWEATIEGELSKARAVVVVWSRSSIASENVKAEARQAHKDGRLVQVFLEACEPPLFFGERQGLDLTGWSGSHEDTAFRDLAHVVRAVMRGEPAKSATLPKPLARSALPFARVALFVVAALAVGTLAWQIGFSGSEARTLSKLEGSWGRPGCPSPQQFSVAGREITVQAQGWASTGRVISVGDGVILSETLSPISDRGRLIELRPEGDRLVLHDRTSDVRQVLERCN
jgi:hypothetical protein